MAYFLDQLTNGLALGCVYALIALGFAMVYGVLHLLNFAHSEVFTAGTYIAYFSETWLLARLPGRALLVLAFALTFSCLGAGLLAMAIERLAYRPLRGQPPITLMITGIAASILLQNLGLLAFGAHTRGFPTISLPWPPRGIAAAVAALSLAALYLIVHRTSFGVRMRAIGEDRETTELMGVNAERIGTLTFFVGGLFAGVAGVVWGLVYGTVHPQMGFVPGLKAFMIAVVGSIGRLDGTFVVGISLGVAEALAAAYLPSGLSAYRDPLIFLGLLLGLAARPHGLFGGAAPEKV